MRGAFEGRASESSPAFGVSGVVNTGGVPELSDDKGVRPGGRRRLQTFAARFDTSAPCQSLAGRAGVRPARYRCISARALMPIGSLTIRREDRTRHYRYRRRVHLMRPWSNGRMQVCQTLRWEFDSPRPLQSPRGVTEEHAGLRIRRVRVRLAPGGPFAGRSKRWLCSGLLIRPDAGSIPVAPTNSLRGRLTGRMAGSEPVDARSTRAPGTFRSKGEMPVSQLGC